MSFPNFGKPAVQLDAVSQADLEAIVFYATGEHSDGYKAYRLTCEILRQSFYRNVTWTHFKETIAKLRAEGVYENR